MRVRFQQIKGMEMLADKEGRMLGSVRRLQIDSKRKKVLGLVFKPRGISAEQWARVSQIKRVGEDVVFLSDAKAVREDAPAGRDVRDLVGLSVTSLDGKRLGALADVILDTETWAVAALLLDGGGEVPLGAKAVLGEDAVLLQRGAVTQVTKRSGKQSGFLSRVFNPDEEVREPPPAKARKTKRKGRRK
jgi:sporulation protein YlmC with PRC-barrel domain